MKKIYFLMAFVPMIAFAQQTITLDEGTIINARLLHDINGKKLDVGDKIDFELADDIIIDTLIVIKKNSKISGTVTDAKGSRMLGKKGKLSFSFDYLYLPNGKVVKLSSEVTKKLKGSGVVVGAGAVLLSPLALLIGGKNAKFKAGDLFECYIAEDTEIKVSETEVKKFEF